MENHMKKREDLNVLANIFSFYNTSEERINNSNLGKAEKKQALKYSQIRNSKQIFKRNLMPFRPKF